MPGGEDDDDDDEDNNEDDDDDDDASQVVHNFPLMALRPLLQYQMTNVRSSVDLVISQ